MQCCKDSPPQKTVYILTTPQRAHIGQNTLAVLKEQNSYKVLIMLLYWCPGDRPTLPELINFQGRGGCINIPQQINTNFLNFGVLLLEDENGANVRSIIHKCTENPEQINMQVFEEWIAGRGKHPVSWHTLIEVLQVIGLGALASDIAAVKCSWVLTDVIFLCWWHYLIRAST